MLRALIVAGLVASLGTVASIASAQMRDFAEGAQGGIEPSIPQMLNDAEELAERWQDDLAIQEPDDFGMEIDLDAVRDRALNHPRVRALLNADDAESGGAGDIDAPRYATNQVFVFASFSMPDASLRALMIEADRLDVPVLFRGFVGNDVFATRERLIDLFGSDENIIGFSIDPTMFTRFAINAVPAVVITREPVEPCQTSGCSADVAPPHDIVRGNIPLVAALDIAVRGGGEGVEVARLMRSRARSLP